MPGILNGVILGKRKWDKYGFNFKSKTAQQNLPYYSTQASSIKIGLKSLGISIRGAEPAYVKEILRRPKEEVFADIEFIKRTGLFNTDAKNGKERILAMLSDRNLIDGLLRWNSKNSIEKDTTARGLLDIK